MASNVINGNKLLRQATRETVIHIQFTQPFMRWWKWRINLGLALVKLGVRITGMALEIDESLKSKVEEPA